MTQRLIKITEIIKTGWDLYLKNLEKFIVPVLILFIIPVVSYLLSLLEFFKADKLNLVGWIIIILIFTVTIFISLWIAILLNLMVNKLYLKENFEIRQLYGESFRKIPAYLWVGFLSGLAIFAGFILLIIPAIIFAVWFDFAPLINILEDKSNKGLEALKASKKLVKGRWWPTLWRLILPPLFVYIIVSIIAVVITYVISGGKVDFNTAESGSILLYNNVSAIIMTVLTPLVIAFVIILYNDLKKNKVTNE